MVVVGIVAVLVEAGRPAILDVGLVFGHRVMVVLDHEVVLPRPHVDVRGHVDQVARARHQLGQPVGAGQRPFRRRGRLHHVNVEVAGARVVRVLRDGALQRRHHGAGVRAWPGAQVGPVVPGREIHQRLGVQRLHVGVVRVLFRQRRERPGVRRVERRAVGYRPGAVALRHRIDQFPLHRRGAGLERHRPPDGGIGRPVHGGVHGRVDVGPHGVGDSPPAHGAGRVGPGAFGVGADRFVVIEGVGEPEALVEVLLRLRRPGGHLAVEGAEIAVERGGALGERRHPRHVMVLVVVLCPHPSRHPRCQGRRQHRPVE